MSRDLYTTSPQMKRYKTIYADPPWLERGGGRICRGAQRHYPLMSTVAICHFTVNDIPVGDLAEENAHLYLWTTNNFLPEALKVLECWRFSYKTMITWAKDRIGLGQYFRGQTEHLIFAVRGVLPYRTKDGKRAQGRTLISAPRSRHSQKPSEARRMIELVSWPEYLEVFARERVAGWDCVGNEV